MYLTKNKSIFVSLKRIFIILILIAVSASSFAQDGRKTTPSPSDQKVATAYPNPAVTNTTIEISKTVYQRGQAIVIFNSIGKKVAEFKNVSEKTNIPLYSYYPGLYIYQVADENGRSLYSGKIFVTK